MNYPREWKETILNKMRPPYHNPIQCQKLPGKKENVDSDNKCDTCGCQAGSISVRYDQSFSNSSALGSHMLTDHGVITNPGSNLENGSAIRIRQQDTDGSVVANQSVFMAGQLPIIGTQGNKSGVGKKRKAALDNHMRLKTRSPERYCSECDKVFFSNPVFKQHNIDTHNMQADYTCEYCSKGFSTHSRMQIHKVTVHPDKVEGRHNCKHCGARYPGYVKV